jgi:hypothetical protein
VLEGAVPIESTDVPRGLKPKREFRFADDEPVHACELRLHVDKVLKGEKHLDTSGALPVLLYLPVPSCSPMYGGVALSGRPALWLLRTDYGLTRTTLDDAATVYPMDAWTTGSEVALQQWSAAEAVTYLVLKPGLIVSERRYPYSSLPIQMADLVGFSKFLAVFRAIYLESSEYHRGLISLSTASFGHCLALAERTAKGMEPEVWMALQPHLDRDVARRSDEVHVRWMTWRSEEALRSALGGRGEAINVLTHLACGTGPLVKARARELLSRYFGIESSALPCIPCE